MQFLKMSHNLWLFSVDLTKDFFVSKSDVSLKYNKISLFIHSEQVVKPQYFIEEKCERK